MTPDRCVAPGRRLVSLGLPALASVALIAGCGPRQAPGNGAENGAQQVAGKGVGAGEAGLPGTPMAQRVAVIGLLNKRNGITRTFSMKPGQALRVDNAIIHLRACETAAPWEEVPETGAFVQLDVRETRDNLWHRVFSGWLFKERPERNVVQHPIYDVWVMSCAMSWPETSPDTVRIAGRAAESNVPNNAAAPGNASESSAPKSGAPVPPSPAAPPPAAAPRAASNSAE